MNVLVSDIGNAVIKGKTASKEIAYPHALRELTETEYQNVIVRAGKAGAPDDYCRVNGKPYVLGPAAERFGVVARRSGAARYTPDYYGVFVAATLARLYDKSVEVAVFGSHPPSDVRYRDDLLQAACNTWTVEIGGMEKVFDVTYANSFDEPAGGLFNVILAQDGQHYQRSDINGGRALVIDIGGHTTDWLAVNAGGEIDYSLQESTALGILGVLRDFERSLRANHSDTFKRVSGALPPDRVRNAIRTGMYQGGGYDLDCQLEANEATNILINRISDTYQTTANGGADYDSIILTGGGAALLHDRLLPVLAHSRVVLADDPATIHLANVRGGLKYWRLLEALNLLDL
jgi:hypothetical protein